MRDLFDFLICLDCTPVVSSSPALLGVEPMGRRFHASCLFIKEGGGVPLLGGTLCLCC